MILRVLALLVVGLAIGALTGCASFKLGGMVYCPYGQTCSFSQEVPSGGSSSDGAAYELPVADLSKYCTTIPCWKK